MNDVLFSMVVSVGVDGLLLNMSYVVSLQLIVSSIQGEMEWNASNAA
jgi:hypothetical protein